VRMGVPTRQAYPGHDILYLPQVHPSFFFNC
jgi:hypothetical protein